MKVLYMYKEETTMKPIKRKHVTEPIRKFKDEFDNMVDRFFKDPFFQEGPLSIFGEDTFTPACNIEELENKYQIVAEMPGIDPDNIDIEIDEYSITIKGEREEKVTTDDKEKHMHMVEHSYGSFRRSFTLPENIDVDKISADYKNGLLTIDLPKTEKNNKRKISIKKND